MSTQSIVPKTVGVYDHQVPCCSYVGLHKYACQHSTEKFGHKLQVTSRKQTNIACYWVSTPCSVKCTCKNVLQIECSVKFVVICDCTTDLFRRVSITVSSTGNRCMHNKEMHIITRFPGVHMWVYVNTHVNKSIVPKTVGVYDHQVPCCSYVGLHKYAWQHKFVHEMQVTSRKQTNIACYWVSTPCSVKGCCYIINTCM